MFVTVPSNDLSQLKLVLFNLDTMKLLNELSPVDHPIHDSFGLYLMTSSRTFDSVVTWAFNKR